MAGFDAMRGLRATHATTGEKIRFGYETPFGAWRVRHAVHLPGDVVLFQLGRQQICVFDPARRALAFLWHGRLPVAVIPGRPPPGESPAQPRAEPPDLRKTN